MFISLLIINFLLSSLKSRSFIIIIIFFKLPVIQYFVYVTIIHLSFKVVHNWLSADLQHNYLIISYSRK